MTMNKKKCWLKGCSCLRGKWVNFLVISQARSQLVKKSVTFKLYSYGLKKSPA